MKKRLDIPSRLMAGLMVFLTLWTSFVQAAPPLAFSTGGALRTAPPPAPVPVAPLPLPVPWVSQDVGGATPAGDAVSADGTNFVVRGGGYWSGANPGESFHFVSRPLLGDGSITACLSNLSGGLAGVMMRETLVGSGRFAMTAIQPGYGVTPWWRFVPEAVSGYDSGRAYTLPTWIKLVRQTNLFSYYHSANGLDWTLIASQTISMTNLIYVGLVACEYTGNSGVVTAIFSNVEVEEPFQGLFISRPPADQFAQVGTTVRFNVVAAGRLPFAYQWYKDGAVLEDTALLSGATANVLTLSNVQTTDAGSYSVVVTNLSGGATSAPARLDVIASLDADFSDRFIREKLAEIGPGVSNAFNFVRDQIGYEAYPGSLRGARGTLWSAAGNSLDKASLLIALLRAQGIGARYARGTLAPADAQIIIDSMFDPVVAANAVGYIPERYPKYDPSADPGLLRWISDHWWVELADGTALDPSFRNAAVGAVRGVKTTNCLEVPDELRHTVVIRLKAEFYAMLLGLNETTPLEVTFSTAEVYGKALTLGHFVNTYQPMSMMGGFKTYTYSPYLMVDDNDADLGNNHLIRGTDYQELFSSLFAIANTTLTRLMLEFEVRDPGKAPDIRSRDLLDRVGFAARHGLGASLAIDTTRPAFTENDLTTIFVTPGFVRPEMVTTCQDALKVISPETEALAAKLGPLTNTPSASLTVENQADLGRYGTLNRWAMIAGGSVVAGAFLLDSDIYTRQMREAHRTLAYYDSPRLTLFEARVAGSDTNATLRMGLDLRRNVILAVPYPDQSAFNFFAFNLAKGRVDGILEHLTVQDFLGGSETNAPGPASPIAVFQAAKTQGISMVALGGEADIPGRLESLPISAEAKARIGVALRSGKQVNVPARMVEVNGVPSIGWWEIDAQTGETVAVSENGGNQDATEFVLISILVFFSAVSVVFLFGERIAKIFTGPSSTVKSVNFSSSKPYNSREALSGVNSGMDKTTILGGIPVTQYADGSVSFTVNGQNVTLSEDTLKLMDKTSEAVGATGSVIDFVGTDVEVICTYFPGTNGMSGPVVSGNGLKLETVPDRAFVVKAGESQIPSSFRARITNTGTNRAEFTLSGTPPDGWNLLFARTNVIIPTNATGEVSVFLQPQEGTPLPAAGEALDFAVNVTRTGTSGAGFQAAGIPLTRPAGTLTPTGGEGWGEGASVQGASVPVTQTVTFVMPEVLGLAFTADPEVLYTSPYGTVTNTLHLLNTGNVTQHVTLTISAPTNFATAGLTSPIDLAPGQSVTQSLRFTAQGIAPDTDFDARVTATYGGTNQFQKQVELRLHVAAPGALQALNAANDARAMKRDALAATLESLGQDLSQLYAHPTNEIFKSRVVANLASLAQQLDDPLLTPFAGALVSARTNLAASTSANLAAALETLGNEMTPLADRLNVMVEHDCELTLKPNSAQALPETPTKFALCLKNKGSQTTTYTLTLAGVPAGITGGLSTNRITLAPGDETSPTLSGAQRVWVTLTQPTNQLTAFEFTVTASAESAPEITRSAVGAFTAREELVQVVSVEANPPFVSAPETRTELGVFTGGDAGEGLDLDGKFVYAVNFCLPPLEVGLIRDAFFTDDTGVISDSHSQQNPKNHPAFGSTTNDDRLEVVMQSVWYGRWFQDVDVTLANLKMGQNYKLQLLFMDQSDNAIFDVAVNGEVLAASLRPGSLAGGVGTVNKAVVVTHRFVATNSTLHLVLYQGVISGLTLEEEVMPTTQVSARVFNAANAVREVLASCTVTDASNVTVFASPPIPVTLSVLSSLDTFNLGTLDAAGWAPGTYNIEVGLTEMDGTPIPGARGQGTLLVGQPVSAKMSVTPALLPSGDGQVGVSLEISSQGGHGLHGLTLLGLVDTPGDAFTVSVRGQYAYVSGSTTNTVVDISDPRNPQVVGGFGAGQRSTLHGDLLLVANGLDLEVYGLTNAAQPILIGSATSGVSGTYQGPVESCGDFGLIHTLVYGWDRYGTPLFIRGDVLSFDLSNPASPHALGLTFSNAVNYPEHPGSDFFIGQKRDHKDGILFLPSTTVSNTAVGGTGRLRLADARGTNPPAWLNDLLVPGTTLLEAVAVQGDRALVVGSTTNFGMRLNLSWYFYLAGPVTLTLLDVSNPTAPTILGSMGQITNIDNRDYDNVQVFPGTNGFYLVSNVARGGKPLLILVDANDPTNLVNRTLEVPTAVMGAVMVSNLIYAVSSSGLAIYDPGRMLGVPITAQVRVPNDGSATIVPDSFNVAPDQIIPGTNSDTLVWHRLLSWAVPDQIITWQSSVANLAANEARSVTLGGSVGFTAWGTESSLGLQPLSVAGQQLLSLAPGWQTVRPGEPASYTLTVTNIAATARSFALSVQGVPTQWVSFAASVVVPPQSRADVPLVLRSDTAAAAGDYGFMVQAQATGDTVSTVGGMLKLSGYPVVADQRCGVVVSLSPPQATAGQGTPASFTVRLVNTGNTTDRYALAAQVPPGFTAQFSRSEVEVMPGLENYREVLLGVTPPVGAIPGTAPQFSVRAVSTNDPAVQHQVTGTIQLVGLGVALGLSPSSGPPGSEFTLSVTNTGLSSQTFDLKLGGAAAPAANWATSGVTLAAGAWQSVAVNVANLDYGHPGSLPLLATATARDDTNVAALASANVVVATNHGLTASFEPAVVGVPSPDKAYALLVVRNTGNAEDRFSARIAGVSGPLTASLRGATNQLVQQVSPVRLPGLASGGLLLEADVTGFGTGAVRVVVSSLENTNLSAEATVTFRSGVWVRFSRERIIEMTYDPVPGVDHFVQYRDGFSQGSAAWTDLPGGPYNRGWYYLCVPENCAAFAPDYAETNRLFLDVGDQPHRDYRLRVVGASAPPLRLRMNRMSALRFEPLPGYDHILQATDQLGAEAQWTDLPRGPHNLGLGFDPQPAVKQRFYRVLIRNP